MSDDDIRSGSAELTQDPEKDHNEYSGGHGTDLPIRDSARHDGRHGDARHNDDDAIQQSTPDAGEANGAPDDEDSELSEIDEEAIADHEAASEADADERGAQAGKRKLDDGYIDESEHDDEARPIEIDEDAVKMLKAAKRKRVDGKGVATKKSRDGRRPPTKRTRGPATAGSVEGHEAESGDDGPAMRSTGDRRASKKAAPQEDNEEILTPEQRRARALERAIDAAVRGPNKGRRKKDDGDLDLEVDEEIAVLKTQMEVACMTDNEARQDGLPALKKLQLLPEVVKLLSRTAIRDRVLDPETNFLQSVRFFLEPLSDATLPSYSIQRELLESLQNLSISKDALVASGLGKVVRFYTRSRNAQPNIKRMAERLVMDWTRPIVKRSDDFKKRHVEMRDYDARAAEVARKQAATEKADKPDAPADYMARLQRERERLLAPEASANRYRSMPLPPSYTIAPRSTFTAPTGDNFRPIGAAGTEAFRRMTQKAKGRSAGGGGGGGGRSKSKF